MKTFRNNSAQSMTNPWRRGLFKIVLAVFCIALIGHPAFSATVTWVGAEEGSAGNGYSVQNWSNPGVAKIYDLGGSEKYGVNGYYQIRPTPNSSPSNVSEAVSAGNNLGITAGTNPTLYSAPVFLNSSGVTGSAGTLVNFGGYSLYRGPDGSTSTLYRQGGLSVSVGSGPYNTPSGTNNGYFGNAFSLTMSSNMGADFRLGVAVDSVGTGSYAPDYVSIFNSSIGTTFSSQLSRNGSPDMAFFDVNANAGESFTAAMWQLAGSNSVAPVSLITFDVSRYKFDVASGQTTTNSVALSGSPAALVKTGDGTLLITSSNTYGGGTTISAGTVKLQGGSVTGNITNNGNLNISADLANSVSGTGSLTKSDAGNATLWSANTYTGATVVEAGQLRLDGSGAISSNSVVQVASGAGFSATGVFKTSNNLTIAGLTGAGQFYNAAGNLTVSKASGTSDVFTGSIDGGTGLIKEGTGTLALGGASTYTGNTTVSAGILLLANGSGLGSTSGGTTVASGAVLRLTNATGMTVGNEALTISGNGAGGSGGALRSVGGATRGKARSPWRRRPPSVQPAGHLSPWMWLPAMRLRQLT